MKKTIKITFIVLIVLAASIILGSRVVVTKKDAPLAEIVETVNIFSALKKEGVDLIPGLPIIVVKQELGFFDAVQNIFYAVFSVVQTIFMIIYAIFYSIFHLIIHSGCIGGEWSSLFEGIFILIAWPLIFLLPILNWIMAFLMPLTPAYFITLLLGGLIAGFLTTYILMTYYEKIVQFLFAD